MSEKEHLIMVLKETQSALLTNNSMKLEHLSDQTIHSASIDQHTDSITIAVIIYSLSKIISKKDYLHVKNWDLSVKKINALINLANSSLEGDDFEKYTSYLEQLRKSISNLSINLKPYIQDVLKKASINKASKIYEHGISLSQTAKLLGISSWELSEYIGQKSIYEKQYNLTLNIKKRAEMALEFFS
ncbi:hypothetical protein AUJ84_01770 [Candidatus Pacearchaeota archaeon CG1_02_32_132]|nr:MAG: hypothetical protein AUJ84_01770 [Candidatus Pacearchaeota archaeon CG1_02_32_132]